MARRQRLDADGAIHHVMNRGVDRQPIFFDDADRIEFGRLLGEVHRRFGLETLAYCLMDNHFHLAVRSPGGHLSEAIGRLAATYVRHTNDRVGRDGPLFRGRFASLPVTSSDYLRDLVRYIHRNALDVSRVRQPEDYRWSSYRAYLGLRRAPDFLRTDDVLSVFGGDVGEFAAFTEGYRPPDRTWSEPVLLATVRREIELHRTLGGSGRTPGERVVLAALVDRLPPESRPLAIRLLGCRTPSALRSARARARRRCERDAELDGLLDRVLFS